MFAAVRDPQWSDHDAMFCVMADETRSFALKEAAVKRNGRNELHATDSKAYVPCLDLGFRQVSNVDRKSHGPLPNKSENGLLADNIVNQCRLGRCALTAANPAKARKVFSPSGNIRMLAA